jgi:pyridoxamine 5'-phosphate oxidase
MQPSIQNDQLETEIWAQLLRASVDKHHEWRSPVLVTNGLDEWPDARTVILRAADVNQKKLTFYSDSRSPKVAQLNANPKAILVFWSKRLNWQLRVKVTIDVVMQGLELQNTWAVVKQSPSAGDYLSAQAPSELLNNAQDLTTKKTQAQAHFAILIANVITIDWLALNRTGHQRANIDADGFHHLVP